MDAPRIDVEWEAFSQGAKPAIRRTVEPSQADALEARWRAGGFAVSRAKCLSPMGGREVAVLYLARSAALADALRDAEEPVLPGSPTYRAGGGPSVIAQHRAVGIALGFAPCCVEAFCARLGRGVDVLDGHRGLSEDYVSSREAWVSRPDPRLNPLLVRARVQVVSFYPCRFDCPAALSVAVATLAAVTKRHGNSIAQRLVAALSRAVLIAPTGARSVAVVRDDAITETSTITDDPRDRALAESLRGAVIDAQGLVAGEGEPPVCAVRFDVGATR